MKQQLEYHCAAVEQQQMAGKQIMPQRVGKGIAQREQGQHDGKDKKDQSICYE